MHNELPQFCILLVFVKFALHAITALWVLSNVMKSKSSLAYSRFVAKALQLTQHENVAKSMLVYSLLQQLCCVPVTPTNIICITFFSLPNVTFNVGVSLTA